MNRTVNVIVLILISILFITLQSTVLSPANRSFFFPDLNLILIVFLAIYTETRGSFLLAAGNGYMMDVLSGNLPGTFTISRLSAYLLVRTSSNHVYLKKIVVQGMVIFFATIFTWAFILSIIKIRSNSGLQISISEVLIQGLVNTVVGVPLFIAAKRVHARFQK